MKQLLTLAVLVTIAAPARAQAPATQADTAGIRATALDYIDGWYTNDGPRMERALHPHLAKRMVFNDTLGHSHLSDMTAMELVQGTIGHPPTPAAQKREDVRILDIYGGAAVVRVDAGGWVDYLQEAKWNGKWVIVNVLWELRPRPGM